MPGLGDSQVRNGRPKGLSFCGARSTLALIGFQAATLSSAFIDTVLVAVERRQEAAGVLDSCRTLRTRRILRRATWRSTSASR